MTTYRLPAIALATVLVVVSAILFPFLGSEFIPRLDEGSREDTRWRIGVELNVRGRDIGSFVEEAQANMSSR